MMNARTVFAAVPVADLPVAVEWWTTVIGREPDKRPAPHMAEFYLHENRDPRQGTLQLITDTQRAGGGIATINVADLRTLVASLNRQGVAIDGDITDLGRIMLATLTDRDGNLVNLVEAPE